MIENDPQLEQAREALSHVERALSALRARVQPINPNLFNAMAENYWSNIRRIREEIDSYLGLAAVVEQSVPLWMVLQGEAVSSRDISSRLLSEWLGNFRKAVYGVSLFLESGQQRFAGGRPDALLLAATDPYVVALAPGSIRVGLRLPDQDVQAELFNQSTQSETTPHRAFRYLLALASWAASESLDIPRDDGMSVDEISVAARFAAKIAPSPRSSVRAVTFSGTLVPFEHGLTLEARSRDRLEGLVKMLSHVTEETVRGQIREIDLDAQRLILRERGAGLGDMKCHVPEALMSVAESYLNKHVRITGLISSAAPDTINAREISLDSTEESVERDSFPNLLLQ
jgi:hypothetical protein